MFCVFEFDRKYAGFGIDWFEGVKGVRLGYASIHCVAIPFVTFMKMHRNAGASKKI